MTDDLSSKGETDWATPRPWSTRHSYNIYGANDRGTANVGGYSDNRMRDGGAAENKANARLIVRAVNSHDALVEALDDLVTRFVAGFPDANEYPPIIKARSALSLARGHTPGDTNG